MPPPHTAATTVKYAASSVQVSISAGQNSKRRSRRGSAIEPRKSAKMRAPPRPAVVSFRRLGRTAGQELSGSFG